MFFSGDFLNSQKFGSVCDWNMIRYICCYYRSFKVVIKDRICDHMINYSRIILIIPSYFAQIPAHAFISHWITWENALKNSFPKLLNLLQVGGRLYSRLYFWYHCLYLISIYCFTIYVKVVLFYLAKGFMRRNSYFPTSVIFSVFIFCFSIFKL